MVGPKPFPAAIRTGVDICHVPRIKKLLEGKSELYLERWASKVFNRLEWASFTQHLAQFKNDPDLLRCEKLAQWLAGR